MARPEPNAGPTAEENGFKGMPCYEFNSRLRKALDDTLCSHCQLYLTTKCPNLGEFLSQLAESEIE